MTIKKIAVEAGIALLVILFLYAGVIKLLHYTHFASDMHNQVFPAWLKSLLILTLPALEILIGVSLIIERLRTIGLYAALLLLFAFTIYALGALLNWFSRTPCSCGGIINILSWPQHLIFNSFFLLVTIVALWLYKNRQSDNPQHQPVSDKRIHA